MALYFIRHGESVSNERNLFAGRVDTPLTSLGRRQALQAAKMIIARVLSFDEIHVSPLVRAFETAQLLESESLHDHVPVVVTEDLVERDFGKLSEQNKGLIKKYFGAASFEHMFHSEFGAPPDGESFLAMYERVKAYYDQVLEPKSRAGAVILVVAHKYIVEMFALIAAGLKPSEYHDFKIPNSKPCSFEELREITKKTMTRVNSVAEEIESRLASLVFIACVVGIAAKFVFHHSLSDGLFNLICLLLLGLCSGIALIRLERKVVWSAASSLKELGPGLLIRGSFALVLLLVPNPLARAAAFFLLLPSALAPAILMIAKLASPSFAIDTVGFSVVFVFTVVVPGVIAQVWRRARPIQAGQIATNWGWIAGAVMIPLALLAGYQYAPESGLLFDRTTAFSFASAILLFCALRFFAWVAMRLSSASARMKKDIYINHVVPNIFFWFALMRVEGDMATLKFAATFVVFLSIYIEELRFVREFPRLAGLSLGEGREQFNVDTGACVS